MYVHFCSLIPDLTNIYLFLFYRFSFIMLFSCLNLEEMLSDVINIITIIIVTTITKLYPLTSWHYVLFFLRLCCTL